MLRNEVDAGVKSCQLALDRMLQVLRDPNKVERLEHYQIAVLATELAATQKHAWIRTWKANVLAWFPRQFASVTTAHSGKPHWPSPPFARLSRKPATSKAAT